MEKVNLTEIVESTLHLHEKEDKNFLGRLIFSWNRAGLRNLNNREYPLPVLTTAVENLNKELKKDNVSGNIEHPGGIHSRLDKVSHVLEKVWMKSGRALAQIRILNTTAGRDTMTLIKSGVKVGASSRGIGEVGPDRKVQPGLMIKSIDLVSAPSFGKDAQITAANIIESYNPTSQDEAFFSLRDNLSNAIKKEFGREVWLVDFSNKEAVFRKEGDTEEQYKKISYRIKGKEIEFAGAAETVKKAVQYEDNKMKKKDKITLEEIRKHRPDLLEEYEQEMKREAILKERFEKAQKLGFNGNFEQYKILVEAEKKEQLLHKRFEEAQKSGYAGNFKQYKELIKNSPVILSEQESLELAARNGNEAAQAKLDKQKKEKEDKANLPERIKYNEAVYSGYPGTFKEWKKLMRLAEAEMLLKEAAQNPNSLLAEVDKAAEAAKKQLREGLSDKEKLEAFHQDLKDEIFEGSFLEWILWQEKKEEEKLEKLKKLYD